MIARADGAGIGVAVVGHAAVIAALLLFYSQADPAPEPPPMEVSFVEEVGPSSSAPEVSEAPSPDIGEEATPAEEESAASAIPEPIRPPVPEPIRPPVETGERRRPDITRNPVQVRPAQPPRVVPQRPQPPRQNRPSPPQPQPRRPSFDEVARRIGSQPGPPTPPAAPAQLSGAQQQALSRQISGLIQPCARAARPPNDLARRISVDLRVTVSASGVPQSHQVVSISDPDDSGYGRNVVDVAMRAVRACAGRIATLPNDHYSIPGGWRTFRYRFRFP